jgi:hypothetical protein
MELLKSKTRTSDILNYDYLSDRLRGDRELAIIAIRRNGHNIENASDQLRDDIDIAKLAISNTHNLDRTVSALSDRLKNDKDLILYALSKKYSHYRLDEVFDFVNDDFRDDMDIAIAMLTHHKSAIKHISTRLQNVPEIKAFYETIPEPEVFRDMLRDPF